MITGSSHRVRWSLRKTDMPDNIDISPGAGATVATDQVGSGRHYQRMKLTDGAEGSENHASVRDRKSVV